MKLDINDGGAWRNVCQFPVEKVEEVKAAAVALLTASLGAYLRLPTLRIQDSHGVVLNWTRTEGWYVPRWAQGREWLP